MKKKHKKIPGEISKFIYDVDIVKAYFDISNEIGEEKAKTFKSTVEYELKFYRYDVNIFFDTKLPYVINSKHPSFDYFISYFLICYEERQISRFLDYQKLNFHNNNFLNLIEYKVLDIIKVNSKNLGIRNNRRLNKIMTWVEERRKEEKLIIEKEVNRPFKNFGSKISDKAKLHSVIKSLCIKVDLLNEQHSSSEDMLRVLTSDDISSEKKNIHLNCKTIIFTYIINELKIYFDYLTPTNIEKSSLFFSIKGKPIKKQNLYSSKVRILKEKETIDNILKQLK